MGVIVPTPTSIPLAAPELVAALVEVEEEPVAAALLDELDDLPQPANATIPRTPVTADAHKRLRNILLHLFLRIGTKSAIRRPPSASA
jgi:hypothetical protein